MASILEVVGPRNGTAPLSYELTELGTVDVMSIFASFDGTAAGGTFRPVVTVRSQSGAIVARSFPTGDTVLAGGSADVTFAPFLRDTGGSATVDGHVIEDEGVALTQRTYLDFVGAGVTATDDAGNDRTIVTVPSSSGIGIGSLGVWGDGSTGAVTLTRASAAPSWATKTGAGATTTFTLNRDIWCTTLDLDDSGGSFLFSPGGYRVFATASVTIDAGVIVHNDGSNATNAVAGGNVAAGSLGSPGTGTGTAGTTGAGVQATTIDNSAAFGATFDAGTPTMVHGGTGGANSGGPGTGGGTAGGQVSLDGNRSIPRDLPRMLTGFTMYAASILATKYGGGGGGTAGNGNGGVIFGGAGGTGGGVLGIYTPVLVNNGVIRANGGNGGAGSGAGNAGGGGGGGGGVIFLIYGSSGSTLGTVQVNGGTGGAPAGTGKTGGTGTAGTIYTLAL